MIHLFTFAHRRPDFIPLQWASLRHLVDDWTFTVFNNAAFDVDKTNYKAINNECFRLEINVLDVTLDRSLADWCQSYESVPLFRADGEYSNPNIACAYPLCWAWEQIAAQPHRKIGILDSDMFFIEPTSLEDVLETAPLAFVPMTRPGGILYIWNAFVLADLKRLPEPETMNWWCGRVRDQSVDVGGQTHHYLQKHEPAYHKIWAERVNDENETGYELLHTLPPHEFPNGVRILHYLRGSNWNNLPAEYHAEKTARLKELYGL